MSDAVIVNHQTSLKSRHTFQLPATAKNFVEVHSVDELRQLIVMPIWKDQPHMILGEGSNTVFIKDFDGTVVCNRIKGIEILTETDDYIDLKIGAGENWHQFVNHAIEKNYGGVENLSLIPGTVGAAPMQNIGAYGAEIKDVFIELEALDVTSGNIVVFDKRKCEFGYRDSYFKRNPQQYIITSVTLRLQKYPAKNISYAALQQQLADTPEEELSIRLISETVMAIRRSKLPDPTKLPNAGSFFKNVVVSIDKFTRLQERYPQIPHYPQGNSVKIPSGWLIEQCGWKGRRLGNVGVFDRQALVLVNYGDADGKQLMALASQIQTDVHDKFDIHLEPEVRLIGAK